MCNQEGMLRRSCAREVFEDNWSQGGPRVQVCACELLHWPVCGTTDRDVREKK